MAENQKNVKIILEKMQQWRSLSEKYEELHARFSQGNLSVEDVPEMQRLNVESAKMLEEITLLLDAKSCILLLLGFRDVIVDVYRDAYGTLEAIQKNAPQEVPPYLPTAAFPVNTAFSTCYSFWAAGQLAVKAIESIRKKLSFE